MISSIRYVTWAGAWISCRFHTRIGSRLREVNASTAAFAPLIVVMQGTRLVSEDRRKAFSSLKLIALDVV